MANKYYLDKSGLTYFWSKIKAKLSNKQDTLVSGTNIKTINSTSLLGSGNISIPAITVDSALSTTSTNPVQNKVINTALGKKVDDMTIQLGLQTSGVHLSKFLTYNYSNTTQYNAKLLKINISSGHPGGNSFKFYEEVIISANYTGNVSVNVFRYYGQSTGSSGQYYGDIFWTIDTTNKIVEFYITSGQYTNMYMSPYKMLIPTTGEGLTQHSGTAVEYSSGEKHWANVYDLGLIDGFNRPTYKGTGVALTSDIPSVDSSLSSTSTNPVQNKVINTALAAKANSADLATVATSGSYNDLTNKPTIPEAITVDSALSSTSTNPVQNRVIYDAIGDVETVLQTLNSGSGV